MSRRTTKKIEYIGLDNVWPSELGYIPHLDEARAVFLSIDAIIYS